MQVGVGDFTPVESLIQPAREHFTMSTKRNSLTAYKLAKKAKGLAGPEGRTLLAIADACSMSEGVCRKSVNTLSEEHFLPSRTFHYGVRGRQRTDGSDYFPGLLRRGIVSIVEGGTPKHGIPTVYRINEDVLRSYCPDTSAQTSAQMESNLCTNETEPLHNGAKTSAQVQ